MVYLGLLISFLIGWVLLPPKWETGLGAKAGFAFAAGMAAVSVQMFAYDLAGFGWGPLRLLLPWVVVAGLAVYRHRSAILQPLWPLKKLDVSALDVPLFLAVLIPLAVWAPFERLMPLTAWDGWAIWLYKAKAFFLDGNLDGFFGGHPEITTHPGYPLLVPLYATFLYVLAGDAVDYSVKILSPCSFVALLGVFHYFAKRWLGNTPALAFTGIVACTPMVGSLAFDYAGYAGTTLSLYLVAAAGFLYEWYKDGGLLNLAGVSLAATAAAWTKNEGQFFFVAVMLAAAAGLAFRKQHQTEPRPSGSGFLEPAITFFTARSIPVPFRLVRVRMWAVWAAPPLAVLVPWSLLRQSYGIQAADFTVGLRFRSDLFAASLQAMLAKAFDTDLFLLTFIVFFAALVAAKPLGAPWWFWLLPALTLWHLFGALLAYSTGRNDIEWWLATSGDRILAQVAPVALLVPVALVSQWMSQAAPREQAAPAAPTSKKAKRRRKARSS